MYQYSTPTGGRSTIGRTAMRTLEPHTERTHNPPKRHFAAQRTEHIQPRQCRRVRNVQALEGLERTRQRIRKYY